MEINSERDFARLSEKLEHNREKEIFKRLVGRPKKGTKAVLFKPKINQLHQPRRLGVPTYIGSPLPFGHHLSMLLPNNTETFFVL
jgi:hypothetical protein